MMFLQIATGQITGHYVPGAINSASHQFGNAQTKEQLMTPNAPLARNLAMPASNLARNVATGVGFSNIANRNSVNTVTAGNTYKANANTNPYLATANIARQNLAPNLGKANTPAARVDISDIAKKYLANAVNPGIAKSAPNKASTLPGNIDNSRMLSQYRLGSSYNNPAQTYNLINSNFASNIATGNKGSANHANVNGWYPNTSGNSHLSLALGRPGSQEYGIHIEADALEIAGNFAVTGNMPFSGTVRLNGRLSTEGTGSVNYACSS